MVNGADGAGRTGHEGTHRSPARYLRLRLGPDKGILARFAEHLRRQLPACVAVDAGGIDEELARDVFRKTLFRVGHYHIITRTTMRSHPVEPAIPLLPLLRKA